MGRNVLFASCLALALGTVACQDQGSESTAPTEPSLQGVGKADLADLALKPGLVRVPRTGHLADGYFGRGNPLIDPTDYVCAPDSPVFDWYDAETTETETQDAAELAVLEAFAAGDVPFLEALLLMDESYPDAQEFGYNGEFTNVMLRTERDTKRFWDIASDDILLLAMKGTMLQDEARVAVVYQTFFVDDPGPPVDPITPAEAALYASIVRDALLSAETLDGGDDPWFSMNAFAFSSPGLQDRIVMGDGILEGYRVIGFGDVAPQAIYAHEFAHHIQYENEYFDDVPPTYPGGPAPTTQAEYTRYTELMADAMAAYQLTHKRGEAMNKHRVAKFLNAFFQLGDCAFTNPGHHGTPNQRMRAAEFGFDLADQAQKQGHILPSEEFKRLFDAAYPDLVAPDAP